MKKILIVMVFALIGSGLYANNEKVVSEKGGKVVADTVKKGRQKLDLQKLLQSGMLPKSRLTQNITPVNVSSTNKKVKINKYVLCDSSCVIQLDVTGCNGKLIGIDTSAYLVAGTNSKYKIKAVKEATLPVDAKTAMTWDAKKNILNLVFPGVKLIVGDWDWELVLSEGKDGVRVKTRFGK